MRYLHIYKHQSIVYYFLITWLLLSSFLCKAQISPDLELTHTVTTPTTKIVNGNSVPTAKPGDKITFVLTLTNKGNGNATGVEISMTDLLASGAFTSVTALPSLGTVAGNKWTFASAITPTTTASLTVTALLAATYNGGVPQCDSWISKETEKDKNIIVGTDLTKSDSLAQVCFTVPIKLKNAQVATLTASLPTGSVIQWYKNGVSLASAGQSPSLSTSQAGNYTFQYTNTFAGLSQGCGAGSCCPICIENFGSIGDFVWKDDNKDGKQDSGELGLKNVIVELYKTDAAGALVGTAIQTTTTDGSGKYLFEGLVSGTYKVKFITSNLPADCQQFTGKDTTPADDFKDSDVDAVTGLSPIITINTDGTGIAKDNPSIDAGVLLTPLLFPDLELTKTVTTPTTKVVNGNTVPTAKPGDKVTFVITLTNKGNGNATGVEISMTDLLATGAFTSVTASPSLGTVTGTKWTFTNAITPLTTASLTVTAVVAATYKGGVPLCNTWISKEVEKDKNIILGTDPTKSDSVAQACFTVPIKVYKTEIVDLTANVPAGSVIQWYRNGVSLGSAGALPLLSATQTGNYTFQYTTTAAGPTQGCGAGSCCPICIVGCGSLGDLVWKDENANGLQDPLEKGIKGVIVELYASDATGSPIGAALKAKMTDLNGAYKFDSLPSGDYVVKFVTTSLPSDCRVITKKDATPNDDTKDSDANPTTGLSPKITIDGDGTGIARNNPTIDAGIIPSYGSIGDYVWKDENANGLQDATEKGIKDVKVELYKTDATGALVGAAIQTATTLADGKYLFDSLASGTYKVKFITSSLPADCRVLTKKDATPNDDTKDSDVDPTTGLSQNVTIDGGGTGIAKDNMTIDAGVLQAYGSIGDVVWKDTNGDGLQGTTTLEPGIKDVRVELYLADVSGNPQLSPIKTKKTDANGKYLFDSLPSGNYFVKFITSTFPADCNTLTKKDVTPNDDTKDSDADPLTGFSQRVTIVATGTGITKDNPTIDAGLLPTFGSLGDYVWKDRNGNGIQDATEKGAKGVTVELYTVSATGVVSTTPLKTAITDSNGKYLFDSLKKGDYKVKFVTATLPADCNKLTSKDKGTDDAKDSDADPTTGFSPTVSIDPSGTGLTKNNPTVDAGIIPLLGSIGDYVWKDKNGNGIQDIGELPVKDVKVELYVSNAAGIPQGAPIRTVMTGANGKYLFDSLDKGDYTVKFITSSLPADCNKLTPQNKGGDPAKDSDADPGTGFTPKVSIDPADPTKKDITTVDAGILQAYATIGDYVWKDTNANGVQDILEKGIKDVVVELYATVNGVPNATPLKTVKTDANGKYTFDSLLSGTYKVKFITSSLPKDCNTLTKANQGSDTAKDSDVDPLTGFSQNVTLDAGGTGLAKDNPTIDAGVIPTYGSIGNYVWKDEDKNGIQGPLEKGVKDVTVQLFKADAQGNTVGAALKTVKTDSNGKYLFDSLASGDYVVKFQTVGLPTDCNKYTDVLQGTPATDSNANPTTGLSPKVTINTNGTGLAKDNDSIDAGLLPTPPDPNIGCPIDAGPDQKICAPESTAKVVAANTKQVWSFLSGPVVASITQSGNITGMIRRGTYKFILTGTEPGVTCKDTLLIKRGILDVADITTCESAAKLIAAPVGHTWAIASGNPAATSITQAGAVSGMTVAGAYKFIIINATCTDTATVTRTPGPDYTANVSAVTCDGLTPKTDGKIILAGFPTGAKADYSIGGTYTGTKTAATASAIPAGGVIVSNLANPTASISQTYTVRVWDVAGCFTDKIVQLIKTDCACPPPKCIPFEMTVIKKK